MPKFRRKAGAVIEAVQFTRDHIEGHLFDKKPLPVGVRQRQASYNANRRTIGTCQFVVTTIHGQDTDIVEGDWIMPEPDGEHFYPCKPDIFETNYEPV